MNGRWLLVISALGLAARVACAQEHPIRLSAKVSGPTTVVGPGGDFTVEIDARIPPGWHLYSVTQPPGGPMRTTIAVGPASVFRLHGAIQASATEVENDPNFGIVTETHSDSAKFSVPIRAVSGIRPGHQAIQLRIGYQTCNSRYCLPPTEDTIGVPVEIGEEVVSGADDRAPLPASSAVPAVALSAGAAGGGALSGDAVPSSPGAPIGETGSGSLMLFLSLAATMGALSLLTPCVFPMVPITITYFSGASQRGRRAAASDALVYALGIVGAFTGLGLALALIFGVAGMNRLAANPWLNLAIGGLFAGFALSLFGWVDMSLPSGLVNWLDRKASAGRAGRIAGTLAMGGMFAVTSFTCTAPFIGTLLVSASQGSWQWPAMGLLVFSSVFALPFMVLALVPEWLSRLPRSGEWMVTLKGALAFVELAAAVKFLSNADLVEGWGIFSRTTVLAIWIVIGALLLLYLLGVRVRRVGFTRMGPVHLLWAIGVLMVVGWLTTGLSGRRLGEVESFLPPAGDHRVGSTGKDELSWRLDDYAGALAEAHRTGRMVLIDFTGFTCTNCRWMEANMFPRVDVRQHLDAFVRVRLFTDGQGEKYRRQQQFEQDRYHTVALPLYAIVDSTGATRGVFLGMTRDSDEFVRFLAGVQVSVR